MDTLVCIKVDLMLVVLDCTIHECARINLYSSYVYTYIYHMGIPHSFEDQLLANRTYRIAESNTYQTYQSRHILYRVAGYVVPVSLNQLHVHTCIISPCLCVYVLIVYGFTVGSVINVHIVRTEIHVNCSSVY